MSKSSDTYCIHSTNTGGRKLSGCDSSQTILPSSITQQILCELIALQRSQATNVFSTKILLGCNAPKFSTTKLLYYTVSKFNLPKFYHIKVYVQMHRKYLTCQVATYTSSSTSLLNKDNGHAIVL